MSPENKQRIVGIVVLVALIALLIPFLFTSGLKQGHKSVAEDALANTSLASMASVTNTPTDKPLIAGDEQAVVAQQTSGQETTNMALPEEMQQQSTSEVQTATLPKEQIDQSQTVSESDQVAPRDVAATSALAKNAEATGTSSEVAAATTEQETASVQTTKSVVKTKKSIIKKKAAASKIKAIQSGSPMYWSVQVGSFSDQARTQKMVQSLQAKGYNVYLQKITTSRGLMVRVLVGRETTKEQAVKIANRLKTTLKIDGRVIRRRK